MTEQNLRNFSINFGPQHPAAHGVLRLVLELDGEVVERVDPHIGLLHRGTEKLMEARTYLQNVPYLDRLDYVAPMNQEHAYALAVERLLGIAVPRARPAYPRALLRDRPAAVASAPDHHAGDGRRRADAAAVGLRRARKADGVLRAGERLAHARRLFPSGGVHQDLPQQARSTTSTPSAIRSSKSATISRRCSPSNRIFKQRNVDIGVVSLADALAWGFSGVMVRGSGAAWDLRKSQPYECYEEMDFDIPVGKNGDCYDRYLIRMEEMRQSVKIMKQCCDKLNSASGKGPVVIDDHKISPPKRGDMKRSMEALIHHFKLYTEGYKVPAGEVYAAVEAPKGEFGVYLVSDGTNKPYRVKLRAPSFAHLAAMDFLCRKHMLADVSAILGSLDIVFGEVDR